MGPSASVALSPAMLYSPLLTTITNFLYLRYTVSRRYVHSHEIAALCCNIFSCVANFDRRATQPGFVLGSSSCFALLRCLDAMLCDSL